MLNAAKDLDFERAAQLRDRIRALEAGHLGIAHAPLREEPSKKKGGPRGRSAKSSAPRGRRKRWAPLPSGARGRRGGARRDQDGGVVIDETASDGDEPDDAEGVAGAERPAPAGSAAGAAKPAKKKRAPRATWLKRAGELPETPGVYLMKDADGKVVYVG
jgi:hypothetical protein